MTSWRELLPGSETAAFEPLALGIELRQREAYDPSRWEARAVVPVTPRLLAQRQDDLQLVARPLVRGAREAWIKADATWDTVRRSSGRFDPMQVRWFAELHALAQALRTTGPFAPSGDTVALDTVDSPLLWPHLLAAEGLGIRIVPMHPQQSVRLARTATARVALDAVGGGALRLSADLEIDTRPVDATHARAIGTAGLFAFEIDRDPVPIVLAAVDLPVPLPALLGGAAVEVPATEATEFVAEVYPRLARRAPLSVGAGVPPPPPARPTLTVDVSYLDDDAVEYRLDWVYPGGFRVAYDDRGDHAERDPRAEAQIGERFETAWMAASDLPALARATLRDADAAVFGARVLPAVDVLDEVRVRTRGTQPTFRELRGDPSLRITAVESLDRDWLDLGIVVTIEGRLIPFGVLFSALSRGRTRIKLSDGAWFSLAHPALQRLRELLEEAATLDEWETGPRLPRTHLALWAEFEDLADQSEAAVEWRELARALRDVSEVPEVPTPTGFRAELRPYQREGLSWLALLHAHRLGGILGDDMGLGKTLQLLALIAHSRARGDARPWLVVAPTSVLPTWRDEAARFAPGLRVAVIEATAVRRDRAIAEIAADVDVVVASYGVVRTDAEEFAAPHWSGVVLDEAQFVKNPATRIHRAIAALRTDAVFAATGTPIENGLDDLWALLALTAPGLFPSIRQFRRTTPARSSSCRRTPPPICRPRPRARTERRPSNVCAVGSALSSSGARKTWWPPICPRNRSRRSRCRSTPRIGRSTTVCCRGSGRKSSDCSTISTDSGSSCSARSRCCACWRWHRGSWTIATRTWAPPSSTCCWSASWRSRPRGTVHWCSASSPLSSTWRRRDWMPPASHTPISTAAPLGAETWSRASARGRRPSSSSASRPGDSD